MSKQELIKIGLEFDTKEEAFAEAEQHKNCFVIDVTWKEGFKIWYLYRMEEFDETVKTIEEGINDGFIRKAEFFYFNETKVKVLKNKETEAIYLPYYRVNKDNGEMKAYIKNSIIDIELTEDRRKQCEEIEVKYIDIIDIIKDFPIVEKENACKSGDMFFENGLLITMYVYELSEQQMKENNLFYPVRCKVDSPLCKYGYRDYALCI